jgi:hypothetical protein
MASMHATSVIPIVFATAGDPVGNKVARQLNERPRKTLGFETRQRNLTPVLRRPVEPAGKSGQTCSRGFDRLGRE